MEGKIGDLHDELRKCKQQLSETVGLIAEQQARMKALETGVKLAIKYLQGKLVWGKNEGLVHRKLRNLLNEGKEEEPSDDS